MAKKKKSENKLKDKPPVPKRDETEETKETKQSFEKSPYLETNIDKLYKLVQEKKSIRVSSAARKLKSKKEEVIEWSNILEEHKLIKMHYPLFGEPILLEKPKIKKRMFKEEEEEIEEKLKKRKKRKLPKGKIFILCVVVFWALFLTYVYTVTSLMTLNVRSKIDFYLGSFLGLFGDFPGALMSNPIYLILTLLIIIVVVWLVILKIKWKSIRKRRKEKKPEKSEGKKGSK